MSWVLRFSVSVLFSKRNRESLLLLYAFCPPFHLPTALPTARYSKSRVLGRFCDYRCVVARWPSRSVVPCRPRPRGPRTPWVRPNSNRRCGVWARQRRRLDSASTAAAKAVSCTSPRGLEAPRACTEVSTTRHGPRRPTRALSLPPLHPDAPRSLCRPRSRHNHRAAARRSARAAVSRARLSPAAQAKTNSVLKGKLERLPSLYPPSCHAAAAALVSPLSLRRGRCRTEVPRPCE